MSQWITAIVASVFAWGAASGIAQGYKVEQLTAEQKTEIRDRVERMKSERAKMETAKPAAPAKAITPAMVTTKPSAPAAYTTPTRPKM